MGEREGEMIEMPVSTVAVSEESPGNKRERLLLPCGFDFGPHKTLNLS